MPQDPWARFDSIFSSPEEEGDRDEWARFDSIFGGRTEADEETPSLRERAMRGLGGVRRRATSARDATDLPRERPEPSPLRGVVPDEARMRLEELDRATVGPTTHERLTATPQDRARKFRSALENIVTRGITLERPIRLPGDDEPEIPESATLESRQRLAREQEPSILEEARRSIVRDFVGGSTEMTGGFAQALGVGQDDPKYGPSTDEALEAIQRTARNLGGKIRLPKIIPQEEPRDYAEDLESAREGLRSAGRGMEETGRGIKEDVPRSLAAKRPFDPTDLRSIAAKVPGEGMRLLGQLGLGALTGPAGFAGPTIVFEGGQQYIETRDKALESGLPEEEAKQLAAETAFKTGGLSTLIEAAPYAAFFKRFPGAKTRMLEGAAERIGGVGRAAGRAGAEASQETAQEALADAMRYAAEVDPEAFQNWRRRYGEAAKIGGFLGGAASPVVDAVESRVETDRGGPEGAGPAPSPDIPLEGPTPDVVPETGVGPGQGLPAGQQIGPRGERASDKVFALAVEAIERRPEQMQYKTEGIGEGGVSNRLKGVEVWDPDAAGTLAVWYDPEAETFVAVDGHHRHELAERLNEEENPTAPSQLNVAEIKAETAEEARAVGALKNIREGRGTVLDAAKYFRDTGMTEEDLQRQGVPLTEHKVKQGLAISNLHPGLFEAFRRKELPVQRAALIGGSGLSGPKQVDLWKQIKDRKSIRNDEIEQLISFAREAEQGTTKQETLFGTEELDETNLMEKAEVAAYIDRELGKRARTFKFASKQQRADLLEGAGVAAGIETDEAGKLGATSEQIRSVFDKLKSRSGPVSEILNDAANRLKEGDDATEVKQDALGRIEQKLRSFVGGAEAEGGERGGEAREARGGTAGESEASEPTGRLRGPEGDVSGPGSLDPIIQKREEELRDLQNRISFMESNGQEVPGQLHSRAQELLEEVRSLKRRRDAAPEQDGGEGPSDEDLEAEGQEILFERPGEYRVGEQLGQGDMFAGSDAPAEGGDQFSLGLDEEAESEFAVADGEVLAPHIYPTGDRSSVQVNRIRSTAEGLKDPNSMSARQLRKAVDEMAEQVPEGANLVPMPSSDGDTRGNMVLAKALAARTGGTVLPILRGSDRGSQLERRREGLPGLGAESLSVRVGARPGHEFIARQLDNAVLLDNVVASGSTAEAARKALGRSLPVVAYAKEADVEGFRRRERKLRRTLEDVDPAQFHYETESELPEPQTDAERHARDEIDRLGPKVERGTADISELKTYRDALALLRRNEGRSDEEMALNARIQRMEGEETLRGTNDNLRLLEDMSEDHLEQTFGSVDEAMRVAREAEQLELSFDSDSDFPTAESRLEQVRRARESQSWVDLRGKTVEGSEDAYRLLRPFRDPRFEKSHVVLLDGEGTVLSHTMGSSGAINYVQYTDWWAQEILDRAERTGAERVVLAHNHPSGRPAPSIDDVGFTFSIGRKLAEHGLDFDGLLIMDGETFGWVSPEDASHYPALRHYDRTKFRTWGDERVQAADVDAAGDWTDQIDDHAVRGPDQVAQMLSGVARPDRVDVLYLTTQNTTLALEPHHPSKMEDLGWLEQRMQALGAQRVVIGVDGRALPGPQEADLSEPDLYDTIVEAVEGAGLSNRVLDVIVHEEVGGEPTSVSSARNEGELSHEQERPPRPIRRLFERGREYGEGPVSDDRPPGSLRGGERRGERGRGEPDDEAARELVNFEDPLDPADPQLSLPLGAQPAEEIDRGDGLEPIGGRLRGRRDPPREPGEPISAPEVIDRLADVVEAAGRVVPIRTGRTPRTARGVFKVRPEVIRIREANNIPTAAHEVAHALEKAVFGRPEGGPWQKPVASQKMQRELAALGRELYGDRTPSGGYKREGFAEFLRYWVTDPEAAPGKAPTFHDWFEGVFLRDHEKVAEALQTARETGRQYRMQGSVGRARANMVDKATVSERVKRRAQEAADVLGYEGMVEELQPLYELAREAERQSGKELSPAEDPFFTASALRYTHAARTRYMVENGMIDLAGNKVGPALNDIRGLVQNAPLPEEHLENSSREELFQIYLWAKRAEALWKDPEGARNPGITLEDTQQILEELQSAHFDRAAGIVYEWADGVLSYAAEASPTFARVVERVRERDPGAYVPLKRDFDRFRSMWAGSSPTTDSPVSRLTGSGRRVKKPLQSLISNAEQTVRAAHERLVFEQMMKLSQIEGMGSMIEEVSPDQAPVLTRTVDEILEAVNRKLMQEQGITVGVDEDAENFDLAATTLTFFSPKNRPDGSEPILPVWDGQQGKIRWFRVNEQIYEALSGLDMYRLPKMVDWVWGSTRRMFRSGTTALKASFGLLWNPIKDIQTFAVNTRSHANAGRLFFEATKGILDAALYRTTGHKSAWLDTFLRLGGEMAQPLGEDIAHTKRVTHKLFQGWTVRTLDPQNWYDWFRDMVQAPETAPRTAELKQVAKEIGWEPGQPMNLDQSLQLLLSAKQVTTDFTAAGKFGKVVNQIIPFFNAAIQGPRATVRAAKRDPGKVAWRVLQMGMLSLWLGWSHKDEDWYKELTHRERYMYWWFPVEMPGGERTLVRIPRAFDVGAASSIFQALYESWYYQDPEKASGWFETLFEVANPLGFDPTDPKTIANLGGVPGTVVGEQLANERFFWDSPIVPMGEERKPAEEQYSEYTTRASRLLGDLFNVSPRRLDHIREGITGKASTDLLEVLGLGTPEEDRETEAADLPIIGRLFRRGGEMGTHPKSVDELYDALEEARKRQASDRMEETPVQRQLRLQLADAARAISALSDVRRATEDREARNAINREVAKVAREAMEAYREGRIERGRFQGLRYEAESRKEGGGEAQTENPRGIRLRTGTGRLRGPNLRTREPRLRGEP